MRIALINSPSLTIQPVSRSMAGGLGFDGGAHILLPPLDLAYMAATLRTAGETVTLIDADPLGLDAEGVYARLRDERWDLLVATVSLPTLESDAAFLTGLVARHPGTRVVAKTLIRDHEVLTALLVKSGAAFAIHGEADLAIVDIAAGRSMAGTAWLEPAGPNQAPRLSFDAGEPVADLDQLPFPARDLLPNTRYVYPLLGSPVTTMQTSRGCPYPCGFYCPYPLVEGTKWRHQSPERIVAELRHIVEELGITRIYFRDATFTLDQDRIATVCDSIIAAGWTLEWTCETRVDCLGDALLEKMRAAGCVGILIGVESGDEHTMHHREGKKGLTVPRLAHLREQAAALGIKLHFLLIVGLPRDTRQSIVDTYDLIQRYRPDSIGVTIITPYPGTPLHAQALQEGWIDSFDWERYGGHHVVMHTPNLSRDELLDGKRLLEEGFAILQRRQIGGHSRPLEAMAAAHQQTLLRWAYDLDTPIALLHAAVPPAAPAKRAPIATATAETRAATVGDGTLTISVVIPTYNRRATLRKTLLAFASQTIATDRFEIIVVDDGSSDDTISMLQHLSRTIPLQVIQRTHEGANAARNAGIRAARGDIVLLTGDDMIPGPGLLESHLKFHTRQASPNDAMLGFIDWSPELTVTPFMHYLVSPEGGQQFAFFKLDVAPATHHFFYASNVSLKRSLLSMQAVLFDPEFTCPAYDDTELGYRLSRQGMTLHYVPQAVTYHHHEMTVAGFANRQRIAGRMAVVLARKHPELASELGVPAASSLDQPRHEHFLTRAIAAITELEKPDLAKFEGMSFNGEDAARFYHRIFLQPCYAEVLKTAYQLGIHEGLTQSRETLPQAAQHRQSTGGFAYDVSIIVPVYGRVELTEQCLTRLAELASGPSWEVIVVDNASTDGTDAFLARLSGDVQIIRNTKNLGFAKACNQGARAARGRHLLFLNNDTIPQAGWLEPLLEELDTQRDVAIVGSKLLYEDGSIQHAGVAFSRLYFGPYHIYRGAPADALVVNQRRELQCVTAACMAIRRDAFEAVGGFDEGYVNGFEDVDLCLKVRERGGRIVYQPQSVLYHLESRTPGRQAHEAENGRRLFARWRHQWWLSDEDSIYVSDGYAYCIDEHTDPPRARLESLQDPATRSRWKLVADTQRVAQRRDTAALGALLARADEWPADGPVLRWAADLCQRSDNGQHADRFWQRLADIGQAAAARWTLARAALEREEFDAAALHIDALLLLSPSNGAGWVLKGNVALRRRRFAEAMHALETAARFGIDTDTVRAGLAMAAQEQEVERSGAALG